MNHFFTDEELKAIAFIWGFASFTQRVTSLAGKTLKQALATGKHLQTSLTIISSLTGASLTTAINLYDEFISPSMEVSERIASIPDPEEDLSSWYEIKTTANHEASDKPRRKREGN